MRWRCAWCGVALVYWLLGATIVWGHAELQGSDPPHGSGLADPPSEIRLWFTESIAPGFTDLTLFDARGRRVELPRARIDPLDSRVLVSTLDGLEPGTYTAAYRVLSAIDGHIDRGVVSFAVGNVESISGDVTLEALGQRDAWLSVTARWLSYLGVVGLAGLTVFRVFVVGPLLPSLAPRLHGLDTRLVRGVTIAAIALGVSSIGQLVHQSIELAGDTTLSAIMLAAETLIVRTRYGGIWLARVALALAIVGLVRGARLTDGQEAHNRWGGAAILGLLGLYTLASQSHLAAAMDGSALGMALSWVHVLALSVWLGSLLGLLLSLSLGLGATLALPVSRVALLSFPAIVISGLAQGLVLVGDPRGLVDTLPGRVLLFKIGVVSVIAALAWINRQTMAQRVSATMSLPAMLGARVRMEAWLAVAAMGLTALLVYLPPAWQTMQQQLRARPVEQVAWLDGEPWRLRIEPGRPGVNVLHIAPLASGERQILGARVLLTYQDAEIPADSVRATIEEQSIRIDGAMLGLAGRWSVEAVLRDTDGQDRLVRFTARLAGPATPFDAPPILRGGGMSASVLVSLGLVTLGLGLLVFVLRTLGTRTWEGRGLVLATLAIVLLGGYVAVRPQPSGAVTALDLRRSVSPIPASPESLARGEELFAAECARCHGAGGRGDGPEFVSRGERLADLRVHLSVGHTDGDLFYWVTTGIRGTEMPGFGEILSEDDRWHVVNAVRAIDSLSSP